MKAFLALLIFFAAAHSSPAQSYVITNLGLPSGYTSSSAKAINEKDQVTGEISHGTQFSHAFLYGSGKMTDLGTLAGFTDSIGNAINDQGEVTGVATKADPADRATNPALIVHAFTTRAGALQDLRPLGRALYMSSGINAAGQIVGGVITLKEQNRAFVYHDGRVVVLDELILKAGSDWKLQEADGINDAGDIVGAGFRSGVLHAFLYHSGEVTDLNRYLPPQADWVLQRAGGINSRGDIVCIGKRGPTSHVFLLSRGVLTDLGTLVGYPNLVEAHLNNSGQVVGQAESEAGGRQCAFLYNHGRLTDLNHTLSPEAHWRLDEANGINDNGVIVGTGEHEGKGRAFLLVPKAK